MMESQWYEELKETHHEEFIGSFDSLRNNPWIEGTGCPLSNQELKVVEKKVKKGEIFRSGGTLGNNSVFYFDTKMSKFVGFIHRPKTLGDLTVTYV